MIFLALILGNDRGQDRSDKETPTPKHLSDPGPSTTACRWSEYRMIEIKDTCPAVTAHTGGRMLGRRKGLLAGALPSRKGRVQVSICLYQILSL